jgi:two-component system, LytTR family, sensor kinase
MAQTRFAKWIKRRKVIGYPGPFTCFFFVTLVGLLSYTRHYVQEKLGVNTQFWPELPEWLMCFYPWAVLAPIVFRLEKRFPLNRPVWPAHLLIHVFGSIVLSYLGFGCAIILSSLIHLLEGKPALPLSPVWTMPLGEFFVQQFFYWSMLATGYALRSRIELQEQQREKTRLALEKSQLETTLRQAELDALRMRLNPHFLFNTLQNISVLTQQNPKIASQMLTRLGSLLRVAFRRDFQPEVTLKEEIALTQTYLEVEKMRLGDRLTIILELDPETRHAYVPSLLLQPLVENAIIHGLRGVSRQGRIAIRSHQDHDRLVLTVSDNGVGLPGKGLDDLRIGIGLSSTYERLERMYPECYQFSAKNLEEGGTEIRIAVPLKLSPERAEIHSYEQVV